MSKINLLSQETIDKIAAGEVVERPASVVKELVENAIDAKATAVTIEIKEGGIGYIRITDNGIGIEKDQLQIAFLRHSTSKITSVEDLLGVKSLGFRGEALSSIAAVSMVEVITKPKDALLGARYVIEGAVEKSLDDIGAPNGTTFIIRQLFYNTPARKKFLKSDATEGGTVFDVVEHLALSHPDISFRFISNGRERLMTSGNGSLKDAIYQIYGREISSKLLDILYEDELIKVEGFIGESVIARGNRAFESFFIEGRYIKSDILSKACEEGYYGFLMGHQFPFVILNISFVSGSVDVNVHPTKQEVRFDNEEAIRKTITNIVSNRLRNRADILEATLKSDDKPLANQEAKKFGTEPFQQARLSEIKKNIVEQIRKDSPYEKKYEPRRPAEVTAEEPLSTGISENTTEKEEAEGTLTKSYPEKKTDIEVPEVSLTTGISENKPEAEAPRNEITYEQTSFLSREAVKEHKIIGQVFDTYWIVEYDKAMYIIDQHAAHEKVLFERTMKQLKENEMTSQMVSPPILVSMSASDLTLFEQYKEGFEAIGFEISSFGGNEVVISAVPGNMLSLNSKELFLELLADCGEYKVSNSMDIVIERVATMSCKAAVKGNNKLSVAEARALIEELMTLENPYHCPHGRPTMISFTEYELSKKFKRII